MPTVLPLEKQDFEPPVFERLLTIERAAHSVPWSAGTLKNNQGGHYHNLKLLNERQIIGFAVCRTVLDEATLFNIALDPCFQGRGWGYLLLGTLMAQLKARGITTLWLEVRESNRKAQHLYERLNFNQVDIRKNYYPTADGRRENAIVMAAYLADLSFADA